MTRSTDTCPPACRCRKHWICVFASGGVLAPQHGFHRNPRASHAGSSGAGAVTFDYGNNIRGQALKAGVSNALDFPGFVPSYIRPLFCEGRGPFAGPPFQATPRTYQ